MADYSARFKELQEKKKKVEGEIAEIDEKLAPLRERLADLREMSPGLDEYLKAPDPDTLKALKEALDEEDPIGPAFRAMVHEIEDLERELQDTSEGPYTEREYLRLHRFDEADEKALEEWTRLRSQIAPLENSRQKLVGEKLEIEASLKKIRVLAAAEGTQLPDAAEQPTEEPSKPEASETRDLVLYPSESYAILNGKQIELTAGQASILEKLIRRHPNKVRRNSLHSAGESIRKAAFKGHEDRFDQLISHDNKGWYRLNANNPKIQD